VLRFCNFQENSAKLNRGWLSGLKAWAYTRRVSYLWEGSKKMRILIGLVGTIALTASAHAADLSAAGGSFKDSDYVPAATWAGFYAGVNGGWAGSAADLKLAAALQDTDDYGQPSNAAAKSFSTNGGFAGGQIGYNIQRDRIVYGIEADLQGSDIHGHSGFTVSAGDVDNAVAASSKLDWFGTVRGRLGFTFGPALVYATGGFAYGEAKDSFSGNFGEPSGTVYGAATKKTTLTGYTIGGGGEYLVAPAWSLKAEYQYIDLGSTVLGGSGANGDGTYSGSLTDNHTYHTVRVGLNYHVGETYEPLK
jgi:outer membrane immunogenic protein